MNPLIPDVWETTLMVTALVHVLLLVWAVIVVLRSGLYSSGPKASLIVLSTVVTAVGPVLALLLCRQSKAVARADRLSA